MIKIKIVRGWLLTGGVIVSLAIFIAGSNLFLYPANAKGFIETIALTPTVDRLAIPEMPEHPTQVEVGENVYYYHCMPCHGDKGQGLTDEWRSVWDADHQNCWGRGCHGSVQNTSFILPTVVPPVIDKTSQPLFQRAQDLFTFLKASHPPQDPGCLNDDEYWAVTAFLFEENGLLPPNGVVGPQSGLAWSLILPWAVLALVLGLVAILFIRTRGYDHQIVG
jgi:hypothetical protein